MNRQAMNSITVHLRTAKLRDQANQLLTLHDDIAELKAAHDVDGGSMLRFQVAMILYSWVG